MKRRKLPTYIAGTVLLFSFAALFAPESTQATTINLDVASAPGPIGPGSIDGAVFSRSFLQPAGTGVFGPFMTVHAKGTEQGYSSSNGNFDTQRGANWNHPITLGSLANVTLNGNQYYQFIVDTNQANGGTKALISLDMLSVWTSPTLQNSTSTDPKTGLFNGSLGTLRYNMSPTLGVNKVLYDDQNHGSGQADINIYIPTSDFAGAKATDNVYMYQAWGYTPGYSTNGGFEETAALQGPGTPPAPPPPSVPEVSTLLPLAALLGALIGFDVWRRRKNAAAVA